MNSEFSIRGWAAFAPGLLTNEEWMAWARAPFLPVGDATPALPEMPPLQRRRVDRLGRMALQVAWWCQQGEADGVPLVFASRHGDLARTCDMLRSLAQGEPLSPTQFGLSTHNAIAAQYSIARNLGGNYLCVSAGAASAEAAVVEALALLADGSDEALVVVYDCPLPEAYASHGDEAETAFAWAVRLGRPGAEDACYGLQVDGGQVGLERDAARVRVVERSTGSLPHGLEVLQFLIGDQPVLEFRDSGRTWRWQRHA